ncbi:MAG: 23S rRNA (pseudouridine(1915)-N(3))-methyltransferase RlmH [Rikenellaceae bacterium]|nr:23S rRNA (pseudouridine(1915)-N(3))-methyltransferase RlmH [Rikenellaceae bacterium]
MVIDLIVVGKTDSAEVEALVTEYQKRVNRYVKFGIVMVPDVRASKNTTPEMVKRSEAALIMKQLAPGDHVVLLDEKGGQLRSVEFAAWMQKKINGATRRLVFVIGGPYGFDREVYARANEALSLSKMTFSHQIVRAIFTEQLYRAFAILRGEPYHHE